MDGVIVKRQKPPLGLYSSVCNYTDFSNLALVFTSWNEKKDRPKTKGLECLVFNFFPVKLYVVHQNNV